MLLFYTKLIVSVFQFGATWLVHVSICMILFQEADFLSLKKT